MQRFLKHFPSFLFPMQKHKKDSLGQSILFWHDYRFDDLLQQLRPTVSDTEIYNVKAT